MSSSAVASSGFSARSASAERPTRSLPATWSSTSRWVAADWASKSISSPATESWRERRIAIASWRTTTFSQAISVAGSTVSSRRT